MPRRERAARIDEAFASIDLEAHQHALVRTYSGGMRRRLEVARALLHQPRVLFLDEPTTGLDPQTRRSLWEKLFELRRRGGVTIFLTTHYLDEAEDCDRLAIIDHGRLVAEGTPDELRRAAGGERVSLATSDDERAADELVRLGAAPERSPDGLEFSVENGDGFLPKLVGFPVPILRLVLRKPTLEDAFIALTGHGIRAEEAGARDVLRRAAKMRGRRA